MTTPEIEKALRVWTRSAPDYRYADGESFDRWSNGLGLSYEFPSSLTAAILASAPPGPRVVALIRVGEAFKSLAIQSLHQIDSPHTCAHDDCPCLFAKTAKAIIEWAELLDQPAEERGARHDHP